MTDNHRYKVVTLSNISAPNFTMTPLELREYIDFQVKRIYFISSPVHDRLTGQHAHRQEEDEIFIQVQGSCTIVVDDGTGKQEIKLTGPQNAIYVPHMVWHGFQDLSQDSIICALTSTNYDPTRADYIENYEEFIELTQGKSENTKI